MRLPYPIDRRAEVLGLLCLVAGVVASFFFYMHFPERVPTHFGISGEPDGWSSRGFAAFFFPWLTVGLYALLTFLPLIDPKRERYAEFGKAYQTLRVILVAYLTALYFAISAYALGLPVNIADVSLFGVGLLYLTIGNFLPKVKPNWFMGVRTPWTLSSETVWRATHRLAGRLFAGGGALLLLSLLLPNYWRFVLLLVLLVPMVLIPVGYSYWLWRTEKHASAE